MDIGFTGTQKGMTAEQSGMLRSILKDYDPDETAMHLGDCIGADKEAHHIADLYDFWLFCHPPVNKSKRAFCKYHFVEVPKEYLERNKDIVDSSDMLIATPGEAQEVMRSGTWSTVRYARRRGLEGIVVLPDGTTTDLNGNKIGTK